MSEIKTQIEESLREMGGEYRWVEWVDILKNMPIETNTGDALAQLGELRMDGVIETAARPKRLPGYRNVQRIFSVKIKQPSPDEYEVIEA